MIIKVCCDFSRFDQIASGHAVTEAEGAKALTHTPLPQPHSIITDLKRHKLYGRHDAVQASTNS